MGKKKRQSRRVSVFGQRLREIREKLTWSQEELAEKSGVNRVQIARLEIGVSAQPNWDTALALAKALNVPCTAFVES